MIDIFLGCRDKFYKYWKVWGWGRHSTVESLHAGIWAPLKVFDKMLELIWKKGLGLGHKDLGFKIRMIGLG